MKAARKRKLVFLDQYKDVGGGQVVLLESVACALWKGFDVTVLAPRGGELESALKKRFPERVTHLPLPEFQLTSKKKSSKDVLRLLKGSSALLKYSRLLSGTHLIYVNGPRWLPVMAALNKALRRPVLIHVHLLHQGLEKRLINKLLEYPYVHAVCVSQTIAEHLDAEFRTRKNIHVVQNALGSGLQDIRFNWHDGELRVATVGRISPEKGQESIIRVAATLPDIEFYIIGHHDFSSPEYEEALKKKAPRNVHFVGKVADIKQKFEELQINTAVIPSTWNEPFGLVAIESMALSCVTLVREKGELVNIARQTTAIGFSSDEDLRRKLSHLSEMSSRQRMAIALKQFSLTREKYDSSGFQKSLAQVLAMHLR